MVRTRGETDAGSAGTQPARDNLAEASKRRQGGANPRLQLRQTLIDFRGRLDVAKHAKAGHPEVHSSESSL